MKRSLFSRILPYLFIAPTFVLMAIFSYYAIGKTVLDSFTDSAFGMKSHWLGLDNYVRAFHDDMFVTSFRNQLIITVTTVFNSIFFPLVAAELLFFVRSERVGKIVKMAFVIPMLVPGLVVTLMWKYLYNPNFGFNTLLRALDLSGLTRNWLNDSSVALICVILTGFPFISGMYFLILHNGLNMVSGELYEAAIIDGATSMQVVRYIHVPNLKPYVKTIFTLSLIGSLSGFGQIYAKTGGGPGYATMIPSLLMYKVAFGDGQFGYASALGMVIMLVIVVLTVVSRKLLKTEE